MATNCSAFEKSNLLNMGWPEQTPYRKIIENIFELYSHSAGFDWPELAHSTHFLLHSYLFGIIWVFVEEHCTVQKKMPWLGYLVCKESCEEVVDVFSNNFFVL